MTLQGQDLQQSCNTCYDCVYIVKSNMQPRHMSRKVMWYVPHSFEKLFSLCSVWVGYGSRRGWSWASVGPGFWAVVAAAFGCWLGLAFLSLAVVQGTCTCLFASALGVFCLWHCGYQPVSAVGCNSHMTFTFVDINTDFRVQASMHWPA